MSKWFDFSTPQLRIESKRWLNEPIYVIQPPYCLGL